MGILVTLDIRNIIFIKQPSGKLEIIPSLLRDMVVGKIWGWVEKIFVKCFAFSCKKNWLSRKDISVPSQNFCIPSQRYLCSLAELLHSLAKIFVFPRRTFAFPRKDICVPSQNFCIPSQRYLCSLGLDKLFLFTLQLAVVTAHWRTTFDNNKIWSND